MHLNLQEEEARNGFLFLYVFNRACLAALLGLLSACASIDSSDYRQVVLVQSSPPGARIFDAQAQFLGTTPAYVRVRRGQHPTINLRFGEGPNQKVELQTKYRWVDSGVLNLAFLTLAPVGWAVDWLTGTMWKMDDPNVVKFEHAPARMGPPHENRVAIAPPKGIEIEASDGLGTLVENNLRKDHWNVLSYHDTAPTFDYYGSSQGLSENKTNRYNLFYQLQAQQVLVGEAVLHPDHLELKGQLKDVYSGNVLRNYSWDFAPQAAQMRESLSWASFYDRYLHFLPNTVFLNLSQYQAKVNIADTENVGHSAREPGVVNTILDYISYLSLAHMERPRENVKAHFTFGLVPAVNLSSKLISFNSYPPIDGVSFKRWNFGIGYGGEVGYLSRYGFAYVDYIPTLTWTQISFSNALRDETLARWSGTVTLETGYSYFVTRHLIAKFFVRTLNEDTGLWRRAIQDAGGNQIDVSSVSSVFTGFAIGYYFPSTLAGGEGWRLVSHASH